MAMYLYISRIILVSTIVILLCLAYIHADNASKISKRSDNLWDELTEQGVNPHSNKTEYEKKLCNTTATTNVECYEPPCDHYDGQPEKCDNKTIVKNCFYTSSCKKCQPDNETPKICEPCNHFNGQKENCESEALVTDCIYSCGKCQPNETAKICHSCDHWNGKQDACRRHPFCYWKCDEGKCAARDDVDEICNIHCVSFCDCQKEEYCYHTSISNSFRNPISDVVETVTDVNTMSCKRVVSWCYLIEPYGGGIFSRSDCLRSNTENNYYFFKGLLCSPPENIDRGNCDVEKDIVHGTFPALSAVENLVFSQIIEQGSYELMLQIDKIDFTNGTPQIYNIYINGMKLNMKFHEYKLYGKETANITVVVYFVAEKGSTQPVEGFAPEAWT